MEGDGYALVFHCPSATLDCDEPDANPVYCLENERMTNQPNQYGITPGPWKLNEAGCVSSHGMPTIEKRNGHLIARMAERNAANARAIAEVPAMIEAIENLAEFLDRYCPQSTGRDLYMNEARAILARIKDAS